MNTITDSVPQLVVRGNVNQADIQQWGQSHKSKRRTVIDFDGHFDAEALRRELRQAYLDGQSNVTGSYRVGYEVEIGEGGEAIGVTNGYGAFKVFYRKPKDIPFLGEPVPLPEDDNGNGLQLHLDF